MAEVRTDVQGRTVVTPSPGEQVLIINAYGLPVKTYYQPGNESADVLFVEVDG